MLKKVKENILSFINSDKHVPFIAAFISGFYPFVFYISNNYSAVNSKEHLAFFVLFFIGIPLLIFSLFYFSFRLNKRLIKYKSHLLFVLLIVVTSSLMFQAIYLVFKKKILLLILILSIALSIKLHKHYKKIIILLMLMCVLPIPKIIIKTYSHLIPMTWSVLPDEIENVQFKHKPNIYLIQPDGYVAEVMMESETYNFKSDLYGWLSINDFKIYPDFRSNYPASLASNASLFSMKQHYFGETLLPSLEVPNARKIISGDNPVISIFKNNDYKTYFIVEDEYFQQNRKESNYDYYNIKLNEIPLFSNDNNIKKDVFLDLNQAISISNKTPKFFFIEKLLPHHVHFSAEENRVETERDWYIKRINEANNWIKTTVNYISKVDPNAMIVILADHGGWVGLESYKDMYSNDNPNLIKSTYSSLAAVKWNGLLTSDYDAYLKSNVNVFRVLFSALSENKAYLQNLESDSSYNLRLGLFSKSVYEVIDSNGNVNIERLNK